MADENNAEKIDGTNYGESPRTGDPSSTPSSYPGACCYEIRVRDHLETYWFEWFEGWSITNLDNGDVLLKGDQVDQSSLHGVLNKIRDLNLTLLSVKCYPMDG